MAVICLDASARKGCRVWGKGRILDLGELFDRLTAEYAEKNMKVFFITFYHAVMKTTFKGSWYIKIKYDMDFYREATRIIKPVIADRDLLIYIAGQVGVVCQAENWRKILDALG